MTDDLTSAQLRGARAMLNWSLMDLAKAAHVSVSVIWRAETSDGHSVPNEVLASIQTTLEAEGVSFLPDDGNGVGIRRRGKRTNLENRH